MEPIIKDKRAAAGDKRKPAPNERHGSGEAREEITPEFLASLAAKFVPRLCFNAPKNAIEAAAKLIDCAREYLKPKEELAFEDMTAEERFDVLRKRAEHDDAYGSFRERISLDHAFELQKQDRFWKGKRQGAYKIRREFVKALREEGLAFSGLPKGTEETLKNFFDGTEGTTTNEAVEETTAQAVAALFERIAKRRRAKDKARKAKK